MKKFFMIVFVLLIIALFYTNEGFDSTSSTLDPTMCVIPKRL
jgi:hypothetical protein